MILITLPADIRIDELDGIRRLRTHAAWYLRQVERHGATYGAKRFARRYREQTRAMRRQLHATTTSSSS